MKLRTKALGIILSASCLAMPVMAGSFSTVPNQAAQEKMDEISNDIPEMRAFEIDAEGNEVEVEPLHLSEAATLSVPSDGFQYIYKYFEYTGGGTRDPYFKMLGRKSQENLSYTQPLTVKYTQESSASSEWSVSPSLELNTKAGNEFLGKLEAKVGVTLTTGHTWGSSTTVEEELVTPPRTWGALTKYNAAIQGNGALVYEKRTASGTSIIGQYKETVGGWAVAKNDTHIVQNDGNLPMPSNFK